MKVSRPTLIAVGISLSAALFASVAGHQVGYNSGFRLGRAEGRQAGKNQFNMEWSKGGSDRAFSAQISDAKVRWNKKNDLALNSVDTNRVPVVMAFSDQVCVQLKLSSGSLGASPVYCYKGETTELLRADDDGE